jgi:hypothetical protein
MDNMTTPTGDDTQDPMAPKPVDENAEETTEENGDAETTEA